MNYPDLLDSIKMYEEEQNQFKKSQQKYKNNIKKLEDEINNNFENYTKIYDIYENLNQLEKISYYYKNYELCISALKYMLDFKKNFDQDDQYRLDRKEILIINNAVSTNILVLSVIRFVNIINAFHEEKLGFNIQYNIDKYKKSYAKELETISNYINYNGLSKPKKNTSIHDNVEKLLIPYTWNESNRKH